MNMVMNNDGAGGLYQANSLASPATWEEDLRERELLGKVDLIFTNPPFGSKIPIDDPAILEKFDLGHAWSYDKEADTWTMTGPSRNPSRRKSCSSNVASSSSSRAPDAWRWSCRTAFSAHPAWAMSAIGF